MCNQVWFPGLWRPPNTWKDGQRTQNKEKNEVKHAWERKVNSHQGKDEETGCVFNLSFLTSVIDWIWGKTRIFKEIQLSSFPFSSRPEKINLFDCKILYYVSEVSPKMYYKPHRASRNKEGDRRKLKAALHQQKKFWDLQWPLRGLCRQLPGLLFPHVSNKEIGIDWLFLKSLSTPSPS